LEFIKYFKLYYEHKEPKRRDLLSKLVQLIHAPESTQSTEIIPLGYTRSYDQVSRRVVAFVHFIEIDKATGKWELRIRSYGELGAKIDPGDERVKKRMSEAAQKGLDYIIFGQRIEPNDEDPRQIEHRLYFNESLNPTMVELHLVMRNEDSGPAKKHIRKYNLDYNTKKKQ
jgi:hypothetical protein